MQTQSLETPKVLIADDDETTRILLRTALTQWGYQVVEARNGEEAWNTLKQSNPPEILTLDWLMPQLDGISLCKRINNELSFHPYIIFLTRMTGSENVIQGLEAGADEFILKPFDLAELRIRVFAGERIIKYRNQIAELTAQLQNTISNMKTLAAEHAKKTIPFSDLIALLQEARNELSEINEKILTNKETNAREIQKINDLQSKLKNIIDIIKGFSSDEKPIETTIQPKQYKASFRVAPAELMTKKDESIINMDRMHAFFGTDIEQIQDFIKTFISLSTEQAKELETAIKNQDSKSAKYFFHLMGSASGNSGMMKIYEICGRGEESSSRLDWKEAAECFSELEAAMEKLKVELENLK